VLILPHFENKSYTSHDPVSSHFYACSEGADYLRMIRMWCWMCLQWQDRSKASDVSAAPGIVLSEGDHRRSACEHQWHWCCQSVIPTESTSHSRPWAWVSSVHVDFVKLLWLGRQTCDQQVVNSSPGHVPLG